MSAVVDAFQAQTERLAARTEAAVLGIYSATDGRARSTPTPPSRSSRQSINRANAAATALADIWLAVQIEMLARQPVPTIGVIPTDDSERLMKAADTILTEPDTAETGWPGSGVLNRWKRRVGAPTTRCRSNRLWRGGCGSSTPTLASSASGGGGRAESGRKPTQCRGIRVVIANPVWCSERVFNPPDTQGD